VAGPVIMKKAARALLWIGLLATLATPAFAETLTISWDPVTTYTDGSPIETGKTATYSAYWTTDPGLGSLHVIGTSLATTYTTFDPAVQGMTRGGTVYFTAKAVLNTGEASAFSPAFPWVVPVIAPPPPALLTGISVSGPSSVDEGGTGSYTATGAWDNGTTTPVTPAWSVPQATYASISSNGVLTASAVTSNRTVTVTASYGGHTGTASVTIVDVPGTAPAAPKNTGITGPTSSVSPPPGRTELYRLTWDPVTTNMDGTTIGPGRIVRYTAYWTDDPALSDGSLHQLASMISGTLLDFDPSANQMAKNQVVFLTVRAILDTGETSPLAPGLTWRVENAGPVPPARGKIIKK
jgi:hypothetical protein